MSHDLYWYNRPCGPYKLATYLRQHGFDIQIIPNCTALTKRGYEQVLKKFGSDKLLWVGFSTTWLPGRRDDDFYTQLNNSTDLIIDSPLQGWFYANVVDKKKYLGCLYTPEFFKDIWNTSKQYNPNCQLVFGGSILTRNPYFTKEKLVPDAVYIKNYAEEPLLALTKRLALGNFSADKLPSNEDYDYNQFKHSSIDYQATDYIASDEWLPIEVARGCAFKCAFCNYDMKDVTNNYVNPECLRKQVIELYEKYGVTKFVIMDDLYNDNLKKVIDLSENCWSKLPFKPELTGYLRLDLLWNRPEQARILLKDGWRIGSFGIETMHDRAGKTVGKGLGKERILDTLKMLKEEWGDQILIHAFFIAGLPYEPMSSLEETAAWLKETDLIHSVTWHYLEVANSNMPTMQFEKSSAMSKDNSKYGYTFIGQKDWVTNVGVTFSQSAEFIQRIHADKMNMPYSRYADLRAIGMTHDLILESACRNYKLFDEAAWEHIPKNRATIKRLLKIIQ